MTILNTELLKKAAALKKQMLRKSNCCVEVVKEVWRSNFSENKAVLKKSLNIPEGTLPFDKKNKKKSQIKLVITFNLNYSPRGVPSPR